LQAIATGFLVAVLLLLSANGFAVRVVVREILRSYRFAMAPVMRFALLSDDWSDASLVARAADFASKNVNLANLAARAALAGRR
jgi:hypothetical protein